MSEQDVTPPSVNILAPKEPGFYMYSGGNQNMIFLLHDGQWWTLFDNTTFEKCEWGYIEQALGVWSLVKLDKGNHWDVNGDLVVLKKTVFRQIGWQIHGGPNDGVVVPEILEKHKLAGMGGFSPVYIEIGD